MYTVGYQIQSTFNDNTQKEYINKMEKPCLLREVTLNKI